VPSTAPTRSARKPKGEGHARRAEILDAAERIFVEHGYEGATIRKIAEAVGLSSTALYIHFADKGEILHEICRQAFETLIDRNRIQVAQAMPPEAKLRLMLEDYVRFGFEQPNAYRLIYLTRPQEADAARTAAEEIGGELYRSFEAVVAEAHAAGRLKGEVRPTAQALWAGAHGVVSLMITKPYFDWVEGQTLTQALLDALFDGLLKP
jgi:AcrR family transcriptional regulator